MREDLETEVARHGASNGRMLTRSPPEGGIHWLRLFHGSWQTGPNESVDHRPATSDNGGVPRRTGRTGASPSEGDSKKVPFTSTTLDGNQNRHHQTSG